MGFLQESPSIQGSIPKCYIALSYFLSLASSNLRRKSSLLRIRLLCCVLEPWKSASQVISHDDLQSGLAGVLPENTRVVGLGRLLKV